MSVLILVLSPSPYLYAYRSAYSSNKLNISCPVCWHNQHTRTSGSRKTRWVMISFPSRCSVEAWAGVPLAACLLHPAAWLDSQFYIRVLDRAITRRFWPRRHGFSLRSVHMEFMVGKVTLRHIHFQALAFPCQLSFR
jgi:hypothetical protein